MSADRSPALIIEFPAGCSLPLRERLVALLADYALLAIVEDDPVSPRSWTAHFESAASRADAAAAVEALSDFGALPATPVDVEDGDWARRTQADLPAIRIGRVLVAPPWDMPAADAAGDAVVVQIEPSRGFGTGHHQSTRLCLVLLQNSEVRGRTVIDAGTGSGVLAIVAARLGAAFVSAFDTDPDAIENARENIERNGVSAIVEAHVRDLEGAGIAAADIVLANLTGTLLARYAAALSALVRPAGRLIVSGFTIDEKRLVADAFATAFDTTDAAEEDGWWALALRKH